MRRKAVALLSAVSLAAPAASAWAASSPAATSPKKRVTVTTKAWTGSAVQADRWGDVQVTIKVRTTTTVVGTKKTVRRKIYNVTATYPDHTDRSVFINEQAIPLLVQETLQAQSAQIDIISRATDTSIAYIESLKTAVVAAHLVKA